MVALIGKEITVEEQGRYRGPLVTFGVRESLWGLDQTVANVKVRFVDGYRRTEKPVFLVITPEEKGVYLHNDCGAGLLLPLDHPGGRKISSEA